MIMVIWNHNTHYNNDKQVLILILILIMILLTIMMVIVIWRRGSAEGGLKKAAELYNIGCFTLPVGTVMVRQGVVEGGLEGSRAL